MSCATANLQQSLRVDQIRRIVADIAVEIYPCGEADWVLRKESPSRRIVESGTVKVEIRFGIKLAGSITWIRREFHSFPSKEAENQAFVSRSLHQSLDLHKCGLRPPGVLIYESDGVSHPPALGSGANSLTEE